MSGSFVVRGARIFDGVRLIPDEGWCVVVQDRLITEVGPDVTGPENALVVDGKGKTLLPGFIDAHTHVFAGDLEQALVFGVTTELDMFADPAVVADLKEKARNSDHLADLRSAGTGATTPGGHPSFLVEMGYYRPFPTLSAPTEAVSFVRDRLTEGADYIKVIIEDGSATGFPSPALAPEVVRALVAAAHREERLAVAHVTAEAGARIAVAAGADVLAHLFADRVAEADLVEAIATARMVVIPTLTVLEALCGTPGGAQLAADPRVTPYLEYWRRDFLSTGFPSPPEPPDPHPAVETAMTTLRALHDAGVTLLAGTDASNPGTAHGASIHGELRLLVQSGLTPTEALRSATSAPAECFRLSDRGRIAAGMQADLVLVEGDPTSDIEATLDIVGVWRRGTPVDREAYRARVDEEGSGGSVG